MESLSSHFSVQVPVKLSAKRSYPILIGDRLLAHIGQVLSGYPVGKKVVVVTSPEIARLYGPSVVAGLVKAGFDGYVVELPAGESVKTLGTVSDLLDQLLALRLERKDTLIALGGGVIGDMVGFAASIYLRGIHLVQVPTTLLAQVDAAIGGKTGVNHTVGKNLIGTFYQPLFVAIDPSVLLSLPDREIRAGLAEVVKYGVICDAPLFRYLETYAKSLVESPKAIEVSVWHYLITRSCQNKARVVSRDEKESGLREILNFGHTIGHALESATGYTHYLHGEAVAVGMKAAAVMAVHMGLLSYQSASRLIRLLVNLGFDLRIPDVSADTVIDLLYTDKKVRDGGLRFVLPTKIGQVTIGHNVTETLIRMVLAEMMAES